LIFNVKIKTFEERKKKKRREREEKRGFLFMATSLRVQ
jgi:hypothetical protein